MFVRRDRLDKTHPKQRYNTMFFITT